MPGKSGELDPLILNQLFFIVWMKCFLFKNHFSISSVVVYMLLNTLIFIGNGISSNSQHAKFKIYCTSGLIMVAIQVYTTQVNFQNIDFHDTTLKS